jgi:putative toxin-antitoxin system antitoxin component (TIGR02293 family)
MAFHGRSSTTHARRIATVLGGPAVFGEKVSTAEQLHGRLRAGLPHAALETLMTRFEFGRDDVSRVLHLPLRTIARRKRERRLQADESDRLCRLARIAAHTEDVLGNAAKAARWLRTPNRALAGQAPLALLDNDLGSRQVEELLGRIEHGVFA